MNSSYLAAFAHPTYRATLTDQVVNRIMKRCPDGIDVVVSASTQTIMLGSLVARRLNKPHAYVRPKPKVHGLGKQVEGAINVGDRAVLLFVPSGIPDEGVSDGVGVISGLGATVDYAIIAGADHPPIKIIEYLDRLSITHEVVSSPQVVDSQGLPRRDSSGPTGSGREPRNQLSQRRTTLTSGRGADHREQVASALLHVGAVVINRANPFRYASGLLSPIYTDCRLLMSRPDEWRIVVDAFVDCIQRRVSAEQIDVLAGTATSGIPHASLIADRLDLPMTYVTFEDVAEGRVEGSLSKGDQVVMIEDHISTGTSVLSSASVLRREGAVVEWCFAIFSYGYPVATRNFEDKDINFETLCDLETLLKVAARQGYIDEAQTDAVLEWRKDPKQWTDQEEKRLKIANATDGH